MPKIQIDKVTNLPVPQSYEKIKTMLSNDPDLTKLDPNYKCQFDDQKCNGSAKGKMFDAQMAISSEGAGSKVTLVVTIPLVVTPFKGKIEHILTKKLTALFG